MVRSVADWLVDRDGLAVHLDVPAEVRMLFAASACAFDGGNRYQRGDSDDDAECRQNRAKPVDTERASAIHHCSTSEVMQSLEAPARALDELIGDDHPSASDIRDALATRRDA